MTFTASNGVPIRRANGGYLTFSHEFGLDLGTMTGITVSQEQALREYFMHERDEEHGLWRSTSDPTWTAVRRNTTIYFQNEDHERSFHFIARLEASIKAWSPDLQKLAYEYIKAHPERKPWHDAKSGEVWVLTIDDSERVPCVVQQYERDFNSISHPLYATFANGSERITDARRIWPEEDAS